jgi:hypothetical protein
LRRRAAPRLARRPLARRPATRLKCEMVHQM